MLPSLDILLEYWIEHITLCLLYAMFTSLLGYSIGEVQTLQLIVHAAFGAVDKPLASCLLVHFLLIYFKW